MLTRLLTLKLAAIGLVSLPPCDARAKKYDFCKMISDPPGLDEQRKYGGLPHEEKCLSKFWSGYDAKPVTEMFDAAGLAKYKTAIQRGECEAARVQLRQQFAKSHPSAPSILQNTNVYKQWSWSAVAEHYGDLAMCFERAKLRELQANIEQQGILAPPYQGPATLNSKLVATYPQLLLDRHHMVFKYELHFENWGKLSRGLFLLQLSREGKSVRYHPHWEAYIAYRLKVAGRDRDDPIIGEVLAREIDGAVRARIEAAARSRNTRAIEAIPKYLD